MVTLRSLIVVSVVVVQVEALALLAARPALLPAAVREMLPVDGAHGRTQCRDLRTRSAGPIWRQLARASYCVLGSRACRNSRPASRGRTRSAAARRPQRIR